MLKSKFFLPFIFIIGVVHYSNAQSKFPLDVSIRWGGVQKLQTYNGDAEFTFESNQAYLDFISTFPRNKEGIEIQYFRRFSVDTTNLTLKLVEEDNEFHKKSGTESYYVFNYITNYYDALRTQNSKLKTPKNFNYKIEFGSRSDTTKSYTLENNENVIFDYVEINNDLFITIDDTIGTKIYQYNSEGKLNEFNFDKVKFHGINFEIIGSYFTQQSNSSKIIRYNVIRQKIDDKINVLMVKFVYDFTSKEVNYEQYTLAENVYDGKHVFYGYITHAKEVDEKLKQFCFSYARQNYNYSGSSISTNTIYSPTIMYQINDEKITELCTLVVEPILGNYRLLYNLNDYKDGYLNLGTYYTNKYIRTKNVDYSDTGEEVVIPHVIVSYINKEGAYHKLLKVSDENKWFGSCFSGNRENSNETFRCYFAVYLGGRDMDVRIGEITIK